MKIYKVFILAMLFLRFVNMLQLMKRFAKNLDLFPSSLPNHICKMYNLALKLWEKQTRMEKNMLIFKHSPKKILVKTRWIFKFLQIIIIIIITTTLSFFKNSIMLVEF